MPVAGAEGALAPLRVVLVASAPAAVRAALGLRMSVKAGTAAHAPAAALELRPVELQPRFEPRCHRRQCCRCSDSRDVVHDARDDRLTGFASNRR